MTLKGGACVLNYSRAVLTNCPRHFGLLFSKVSLRTQTYFRLSLVSGDKIPLEDEGDETRPRGCKYPTVRAC